MNDEKRLDALLAELGKATDLDAPGALEVRLRALLSEAPSARATRGGRARSWLLAAAVVAAVALGAMLRPGGRERPLTPPAPQARLPRSEPLRPAPERLPPPSATVAPALVARTQPAPAPVLPAVTARRHARRAPVPLPPPRERATFIALSGAPALSEADSLHVARVLVPRTALAAWGWPLRPGEASGEAGPLEAEVIVGQDGLARAIRFVTAEDGGRRQ